MNKSKIVRLPYFVIYTHMALKSHTLETGRNLESVPNNQTLRKYIAHFLLLCKNSDSKSILHTNLQHQHCVIKKHSFKQGYTIKVKLKMWFQWGKKSNLKKA